MFLVYCYRDHRDLHSFPTRRSSDLVIALHRSHDASQRLRLGGYFWRNRRSHDKARHQRLFRSKEEALVTRFIEIGEHTSELQSQSNLVCRLLLEKKKNHRIFTLASP